MAQKFTEFINVMYINIVQGSPHIPVPYMLSNILMNKQNSLNNKPPLPFETHYGYPAVSCPCTGMLVTAC